MPPPPSLHTCIFLHAHTHTTERYSVWITDMGLKPCYIHSKCVEVSSHVQCSCIRARTYVRNSSLHAQIHCEWCHAAVTNCFVILNSSTMFSTIHNRAFYVHKNHFHAGVPLIHYHCTHSARSGLWSQLSSRGLRSDSRSQLKSQITSTQSIEKLLIWTDLIISESVLK